MPTHKLTAQQVVNRLIAPGARPRLRENDGAEEVDMNDALERWFRAGRVHHMEGDSGIRALENLVAGLDPSYSSLERFFYDNSGAIEAVVEWIREQNVPHWVDNLTAETEAGELDAKDDADERVGDLDDKDGDLPPAPSAPVA